MGSRFHEVMEHLYRGIPHRVPSVEELNALFLKLWEAKWSDDIRIVRRDRKVEDYKAVGLRAIEDYCRRYSPFDQGRVLGLERNLHCDLDGSGRYRLRCILDRIMGDADGRFEIHDYKTSASLPEQARLDDVNGLVGPKRFETVQLVKSVVDVERRDPAGQGAGNLLGIAVVQLSPAFVSRVVLRRLEVLQQSLDRCAGNSWLGDQGSIFGRNPPYTTVSVIAAWVAKVVLHMADQSIVPIENVDRAVRSHFDVHGPKIFFCRH